MAQTKSSDLGQLAEKLSELGREARSRTGASDVVLLKRLKFSSRTSEVFGRGVLQFITGPWGWGVGFAAVAYHLALEAQLNHSIMHGAYSDLPGAEKYTPGRYETLALPFQSRTWGEAHRIHHGHPSLIGDDPDTIHPLFRIHQSQKWRWWNFFNTFIGSIFVFEFWAFDYDRFLKEKKLRDPKDRGEIKKFARFLAYQYFLFPLLAGHRWKEVLAANLAAVIARNFVFTGLQTASSVGHGVSTLHHGAYGAKPRGQWYKFQIETSKNFVLKGIWRIICGGLDRHIEHHLYPRLPPNRLYELSEPIKNLCRENSVRYEEHDSFWGSLKDSLSYLASLSRPSR